MAHKYHISIEPCQSRILLDTFKFTRLSVSWTRVKVEIWCFKHHGKCAKQKKHDTQLQDS